MIKKNPLIRISVLLICLVLPLILLQFSVSHPAPSITGTEEYNYEFSSPEIEISYNITSIGRNYATYYLYMDENLIETSHITHPQTLTYSPTGISLGNHEFRLLVVADGDRKAEFTSLVEITNKAPVITSVFALPQYEIGNHKNLLSWTIEDYSITPEATYNITQFYDGEAALMDHGIWHSPQISISLKDLLVGDYTYTLIMDDGLGGITQSLQYFSIKENLAPTINVPEATILEQGVMASFNWEISDFVGGSGNYDILFDDQILDSGDWSGTQDITFELGTHLYDIGIYELEIVAQEENDGLITRASSRISIADNVRPELSTESFQFSTNTTDSNIITAHISDFHLRENSTYTLFKNNLALLSGDLNQFFLNDQDNSAYVELEIPENFIYEGENEYRLVVTDGIISSFDLTFTVTLVSIIDDDPALPPLDWIGSVPELVLCIVGLLLTLSVSISWKKIGSSVRKLSHKLKPNRKNSSETENLVSTPVVFSNNGSISRFSTHSISKRKNKRAGKILITFICMFLMGANMDLIFGNAFGGGDFPIDDFDISVFNPEIGITGWDENRTEFNIRVYDDLLLDFYLPVDASVSIEILSEDGYVVYQDRTDYIGDNDISLSVLMDPERHEYIENIVSDPNIEDPEDLQANRNFIPGYSYSVRVAAYAQTNFPDILGYSDSFNFTVIKAKSQIVFDLVDGYERGVYCVDNMMDIVDSYVDYHFTARLVNSLDFQRSVSGETINIYTLNPDTQSYQFLDSAITNTDGSIHYINRQYSIDLYLAEFSFVGSEYYEGVATTDQLDPNHIEDFTYDYSSPDPDLISEGDQQTSSGDTTVIHSLTELRRTYSWANTDTTLGFLHDPLTETFPGVLPNINVSESLSALYIGSVSTYSGSVTLLSPAIYYYGNEIAWANLTLLFSTLNDRNGMADDLSSAIFNVDIHLYDERLDLLEIVPFYTGLFTEFITNTISFDPVNFATPKAFHIGINVEILTGTTNTSYDYLDEIYFLMRVIRKDTGTTFFFYNLFLGV